MQHLFRPEGELALALILQQRPLLAFDFDGTLTPIVARPSDAHLSTAVSARLHALTHLLPVAIVTGRSVDDVRGRLGFEPHYIVGNHGAEQESGATDAALASPALLRLRLQLQEQASRLVAAGVTIEDKGASLALHYRLSRTRAQAQQLIAELLVDPDEELRVFGGKLVVNVTSRQAPDKADAVHALLQRCGATCAIFAGDDVNDEPVFASAPPEWLTIRIGRDEPRSKAHYVLNSPAEMAMLLERMVSLVTPR